MKKIIDYWSYGAAFVILLITSSFFAAAQYELGIKQEREDESSLKESADKPQEVTGEIGNNASRVVIYTPPRIPAPQSVIDGINNYIISNLGEDYFNEHFGLVEARQLGRRYIPQNQTFEPTYLFTYNYTYELKEEPNSAPIKVWHLFNLRVLNDGNFMSDIKDPGPREPYRFLISKSEARDIGMQNGMKEPQVELYYGGQGYNSDRHIERGTYLWGVWEDCAPEGNVEGLFIHVDTGEILGKRISGGCGIEVAAKDIELGYRYKEEQSSEPTSPVEFKHENFFQKITSWLNFLFTKKGAK